MSKETKETFENVCRIKKGTKAYNAAIDLQLWDKMTEPAMLAFVEGKISHLRVRELHILRLKRTAKAWRAILDYAGLQEGVNARVQWVSNEPTVQVEIENIVED